MPRIRVSGMSGNRGSSRFRTSSDIRSITMETTIFRDVLNLILTMDLFKQFLVTRVHLTNDRRSNSATGAIATAATTATAALTTDAGHICFRLVIPLQNQNSLFLISKKYLHLISSCYGDFQFKFLDNKLVVFVVLENGPESLVYHLNLTLDKELVASEHFG